jgi:hypothetical protein
VGADPPIPSRPDRRPRRLRLASWLVLVAAAGVALAAILLFPESGGDAPPLASLALIGAIIAAATTGALYLIVRRDLGLPRSAGLALVLAFALVVLVKFVLAPQGLYEVNAVRALEDMFGSVADQGGAIVTAGAIFGLYAVVYWIVFRVGYRDPLPGHRRRRGEERTGGRLPAVLRILLIAVAIGFAAGGFFIGLIVLSAPRQYVEFVFSSWAGAGIAAALVLAAALILRVFRLYDDRPELLAEVGTVITLFWLGLGFLALYHALWIVYVLVLGSIWPLRTVTPK